MVTAEQNRSFYLVLVQMACLVVYPYYSYQQVDPVLHRTLDLALKAPSLEHFAPEYIREIAFFSCTDLPNLDLPIRHRLEFLLQYK